MAEANGTRQRRPAAAQLHHFEFIEVWDNRERRHSTLGYVSPVEYEARLQAT